MLIQDKNKANIRVNVEDPFNKQKPLIIKNAANVKNFPFLNTID